MQPAAGTILQATPLLDGSFFERATILITAYNSNGAAGFVLDRPFPKKLNDLVEFSSSKPFPLHDGGPVERDGLFFIHQHAAIIENSEPINNGWYYGGNFKQAVAAINDGRITEQTLKLFIGYCGWDTGELEAEVEEGSWKPGNAGFP